MKKSKKTVKERRDSLARNISDILMEIDALKSSPVTMKSKEYREKLLELGRLRRKRARLGRLKG